MAGRQDVFQQKMNLGHSAAWDQLWENARDFYCQALEEFPDHPNALTHLGLAYVELQNYPSALQCYEKTARVTPSDPVPFEKIAQLYERLGNIDRAEMASLRAADLYINAKDMPKAIQNLERIICLNPANLQARSRLALIYERRGENQLAIKEYLAAASILQAKGELDHAHSAVKHALSLDPQCEDARQAYGMLKDFRALPKPTRLPGGTAPLLMAQVRQLSQDEQGGETEDIQANPVDLACQAALTILADMLFEMPEDEALEKQPGIQAIVAGISPGGKTTGKTLIALHLSQVIDFQVRGEFNRAADELKRAMDAGLAHTAADFDIGYLLIKCGRTEPGARYIQKAVKHPQFSLAVRLLLGEYAFHREDYKQSVGHYLEALRIADMQVVSPKHSIELSQLYDPLIETFIRKEVPALKDISENIHALLMQPGWKKGLIQARNQLSEQQIGSIRPVAEILAESRSGQLIDAIGKVRNYENQGLFRAAMDQAYCAIDLAPTYLPLHRLMGDILVKQGNIPAGLSKYQAVAKAYTSRGDTQQAIILYRSILELAPTDLLTRNRLISQLVAADQVESAVQEYMNLAEVYYRQADFSTSRKIYSDALRIAHQNHVDRSLRVSILHRIGDIDMQSLEWRQALRVYEQIRTLEPKDQKARCRLVELNLRLNQEKQAFLELDQYVDYLMESRQPEAAIGFLQNLVNENPNQIPIRRRLADLFRSVGRKQEAVTQLDAMGELLLEGGDKAGAIQIIDALLQLEPANRDAYKLLLDQLRG